MTEAAGYTRLSQASDTSIDRQKRHIEEYAEENELELTTIYDEGQRASGFDTNREKYDELVEAAREGEVDAIIVNDRSRLGRDQWQRMQHFSELVREGVEFHTWEDGYIDPDEPVALLQEAMYAQQHDQAKREEVEKSKAATQERIDRGCYQGTPPYGLQFCDDGCHLEKDEAQWEELEQIWSEVEDSTLSEVAEGVSLSVASVSRVANRGREWYEQRLEEYGE